MNRSRSSSSEEDKYQPSAEIPQIAESHTKEEESMREMQYIDKKIEPILSDMMVKIINEQPKDIISFMLQHLRKLKQQRDNEIKMKQKPK